MYGCLKGVRLVPQACGLLDGLLASAYSQQERIDALRARELENPFGYLGAFPLSHPELANV
jgi:hypothetical protein